jgi:hypothetical protein
MIGMKLVNWLTKIKDRLILELSAHRQYPILANCITVLGRGSALPVEVIVYANLIFT